MRSVRTVVPMLVLVLGMSAGAMAAEKPEGWKFDSLTVSAGEDALSSGITGSLWMENEEHHLSFNAVVQHEQGWFLVGKRFTLGKLKVNAAGTIGHSFGEAWIGPYLDASLPLGKLGKLPVSVSTLQWPCVFGREPERWRTDGKPPNTEPLFIGFFMNYTLSVGPVSVTYGGLVFLDDPYNSLPGVSYTKKLRKDFAISASLTRNINAKKFMYYVGSTWSPGTK